MNLLSNKDQSAQVSVAMNDVMKRQGVCTPIELNTFMNDVDSGPFKPGGQLARLLAAQDFEFVDFQMTLAQASKFLAFFTKAEATEIGQSKSYVAILGNLVQTYLTARSSGESTLATEKQMIALFSSTFGTLRVKSLTHANSVIALPSESPVVSIAYASYLTTYLPESFFVGEPATPASP